MSKKEQEKQQAWINWESWMRDRGIEFIRDNETHMRDYRRTRREIREIMELNMVLYGKW